MSNGRYPTRSKPTRHKSADERPYNPYSQEVILIEDSPTPTTVSSVVGSGHYSHAPSRPATATSTVQASQPGVFPGLAEGYADTFAHYTRGAAAQASKRVRSNDHLATGMLVQPTSNANYVPHVQQQLQQPLYSHPQQTGNVLTERLAQLNDSTYKYRPVSHSMADPGMRTPHAATNPASAGSQRSMTSTTWLPTVGNASPASPSVGNTPFLTSQQALTASSAGKRKRDETQLLQQRQQQLYIQQQQAIVASRAPISKVPVTQAPKETRQFARYRPQAKVDVLKSQPVSLRKEYSAQWEALGAGNFDDSEGHYVVVPNSKLTQRYKIIRLLGQGTFGKVVQAYDNLERVFVAIKIIRAVQKYRDASMIELRVLRTLWQRDPHNWNNCIHLRDCFDYRNHVCIVTDLLGESIFDFLKGNDFSPFPRKHIQEFAKQLFKSVGFLHELNLIHTDLKPENILLVSNESHLEPWRGRSPNVVTRKVLESSDIRLIDFGSATFEDEYHSTVVSTRHYRAPEIILGMGWSYPCDIWSIGCILLELFTGDALFQTHDNLEHLAMMEVVCGPMDGRIVRSASKLAQKMFRSNGRLDYPNKETSKDSRKFVKQMKTLREMLPPRQSVFCEQFGKLLEEIFVYDTSKRISAQEALAHKFFQIDPSR